MTVNSYLHNFIFKLKRRYYYGLIKIYPALAIRILYYKNTGKRLDLKKVKTYNEKIQWIKAYEITGLMKICADKLEMRRFINIIGLSELLPELYGSYNSIDEIKFEDFPNRFVLKLNHGWSFNILIEDKSKMNLKLVRKQISNWQSQKFGCLTGEVQYFDIKPKIICEEFLGRPYEEILDYKVLCFNGEPTVIQVDETRFSNHKRDFYDTSWNKLDIKYGYEWIESPLKKPPQLPELLEISHQISRFFKHVRVDFYIINSKIYLGELTFTPTAGYKEFFPDKYNEILGELIKIGGRKRI